MNGFVSSSSCAHVLLPGDSGKAGPTVLGVVGGGQLGRMFVHAAQAMGYATAVLDPDPDSPAGRVAHHHVRAAYDDEAGLRRMLQLCDAVTTEFENVPASVLERLSVERPTAPGAAAVATCQDRRREKAQFTLCAVPCAPYAAVTGMDDFAAIPEELFPGILKTAQLGYDGKGQVRVTQRAQLAAAWNELGQVPCVLEMLLPLQSELSVIVARNAEGTVVHLPVQQNLHRSGVLAVTSVPAPDISEPTCRLAYEAAGEIARAMSYVGVLCVEFFVLQDGSLVANEMAPRPHNSGHYSIDACDVSQFDLQVRCMAGLPICSPRQHSSAIMLNLLGDLWFDAQGRQVTPPWERVLALGGTHLHLYGKNLPRPGRKMGHLTVTAATYDSARDVALASARLLGIAAF